MTKSLKSFVNIFVHKKILVVSPKHILVMESRKLKETWQYMVVHGVILTKNCQKLLLGNVSSWNENSSLFLPQNGCALVTVAGGRCQNCRKNQLKCRSIYHRSNYFCRRRRIICVFLPTETKLKTFCKVSVRCGARPAWPESLRSLVQFRPWFHICHICDFIFTAPPSSSPRDISLKTSICHLRCVKAGPDNQTADGALQPSLFCNMPRFFWDSLYFSVKSFLYLLL